MKVYVGQTTGSIIDRWRGHLSAARVWKRTKNDLSQVLVVDRAVAKYGEENFVINELCRVETKEELDFLETLFIISLKATDLTYGYNLREGGSRSAIHDSTKKLISKRNKERGRGRKNWISDGINSIVILKETPIPEGWKLGRIVTWMSGPKTLDQIKKLVEARRKGKGWRQPKPTNRFNLSEEANQRRILKVRTGIHKTKRSSLRICYICFKPFNASGHTESVSCGRSCHYKMDKIMSELGNSLAKLYWDKLSPEGRIVEMKRRKQITKEKKKCRI